MKKIKDYRGIFILIILIAAICFMAASSMLAFSYNMPMICLAFAANTLVLVPIAFMVAHKIE